MAETQFPESAAASQADASGPRPHRRGPMIIALLVVVLIVLYQDTWFWESDHLVFGFMPIGLFYHAMLSIAASLVWLLATWIAWPIETIEQAKRATQVREAHE